MAKPFLQCHHRFKNGKDHCYWSIAEKVRTRRGWVQRHLLYLGEINDSQKTAWTKTVDVFDTTRQQTQELALYPADRAIPEHAADYGVQVRLSEFELRRSRQWGACWVGCQLWDQLHLNRFWQERLPDSREGTSWRHVLQTLTIYRLIDPGSEWRLHRQWFKNSALADLLEEDFSLAQKDNLYRCLDKLLEHREPLFQHLRQRWEDLFGVKFEVLLYDLTSTYFESDPPFPQGDRLWQFYIQLTHVEAAFKDLKDDLSLRPVYHQLEQRIEAHIFVAFLACCLHVSLRARLRVLAPGLTPRSMLEKFAAIQMLDVHFPTTDGRELVFCRYTQPEKDHKMLLAQLGWELPPQSPPRITQKGELLKE